MSSLSLIPCTVAIAFLGDFSFSAHNVNGKTTYLKTISLKITLQLQRNHSVNLKFNRLKALVLLLFVANIVEVTQDMGNTDSIPVISQAKSAVQYAAGDAAGALQTQENFAYNNTFPVISQIASAGYAIGGDPEKAKDLQIQFAKDMERVIDSIPIAGHIKGGVHYALGDKKSGDEAMKAASHSTGVVIGAVGGGLVGGPAGAVAGGVAGGIAADGIITEGEILANGKENATSYCYIAAGETVADAIKGKSKITPGQGVDMALMPIADGLGGLAVNEIGGLSVGGKLVTAGEKVEGSVVAGGKLKPIIANGEKAVLIPEKIGSSVIDDSTVRLRRRGKVAMDRAALDNRANQLNPNHKASGPGKPRGYKGAGTKADLDNRANQLNPNNAKTGPVSLKKTKVPEAKAAASAGLGDEARLQATGDKDPNTSKPAKSTGFLSPLLSAAYQLSEFLMKNMWAVLGIVIALIGLLISFLTGFFNCCGLVYWRRRSDRKGTGGSPSIQGGDVEAAAQSEPIGDHATVFLTPTTQSSERTPLLSPVV